MTSLLSAHIEMGVTELIVKDLREEVSFYHDLVGIPVIEESESKVLLGFEKRPVLLLSSTTELHFTSPKSAGLYHVAILFEHRAALAQALWRILRLHPEYFHGSANHLVSEAFYFADPEGNGVELYADKDPDTWVWKNGNVHMASEYVDVQDFITTHAQNESPLTAKMGHVHLKVGSLLEAKQFYVGTLGFHVTAEMQSALFLSDGKYHHHLGMNTWESYGAGLRKASLGVGKVKILLAEKADLSLLEQRLKDVLLPYTLSEQELHVQDPWGNALVFAHRG